MSRPAAIAVLSAVAVIFAAVLVVAIWAIGSLPDPTTHAGATPACATTGATR